MHRFFVHTNCINGETVELPGAVSRQLYQVLRCRPGDQIILLDNSGVEYYVKLESVDQKRVTGIVTEIGKGKGDPKTKITLYQGILKSDKFEFVLQKGTELGVSDFVPTLCSRSIPTLNNNNWSKNRQSRCLKIISEATEQCGRSVMPILRNPIDFWSACDHAEGFKLILSEYEHKTSLKKALTALNVRDYHNTRTSVFVGPEGGFTQNEIDHARTRNIAAVSLGNRTLRAETAGIAAVTSILYEFQELDP